MGAFDDYRNRLTQYGGSSAQSFDNDTANFINTTFAQSPTYLQIAVDGANTDSRVLRTQNPHVKTALFRPSTKIHEGAMVTLNGDTWLVQMFEPHPLFPKAKILQCNESLRWHDSGGTLHTQPCVFVSLHRMVALTQDTAMETTKYQMRVFVQYQNADNRSIQVGQRFILGGTAYIAVGIDDVSTVYDGYGLIDVSVESTQSMAGDDMVNKIADNSHLWTKDNGGATGGGTASW